MKDLVSTQTVQPGTNFDTNEEQGALSFDALFSLLRRFWLLIIFFSLLGGGVAYYYSGSQGYVYSKSASVMMKSDNAGSIDAISVSILGDLGMGTGAANLANESYILKSTALMLAVVDKLDLNTTYWRREQFREIELYGQSPVLVRFHDMDEDRACTITITPEDETHFSMSYDSTDGESERIPGTYGESISLPFGSIVVSPTSAMGAEWVGIPIAVRHVPALTAAQGLLASLTVTRPDLKEASMLELTITSTHPRKAEDVLNQLIEAYNRRSMDEKSEAARKARTFIQERLTALGRDLDADDTKLSDVRRSNDLVAASASPSVVAASSSADSNLHAVEEIEQQIFELQTQLNLVDSTAVKLANHSDSLISLGTGISDPSFSSKVEAYNEAWQGYHRIAQSAGSRNPLVVEKREAMVATLAAARTALQNYRGTVELKLQKLREKQLERKERARVIAEQEQELAPLVREHKVKEELYMMLLTKEQENALTLAIAEPSARVLESAHGSDAPIAPQTPLYVVVGAGGGIVFCLLSLLTYNMLNRKVGDKHDISPYSSQPVLAELPSLSRRERNAKEGLVLKAAHSTMAECLHILRNNLDSLLPRPDRGGHAILITSSMAGEGKTLISANLAATYAQAGRRVLLIDGDLRKASLTRDLGGKGRGGLTSLLLRSESDFRKIIHPLPGCGVGEKEEDADSPTYGGRAEVLYAGPMVPNPITLLTQPMFADLLSTLKQNYDVVLIDAPPTGILADTDIIAAQVDISLYVVRAGLIDKRYLTQVQKMADSGKLPHTAFVVNSVNFQTRSYRHYGYGYGYYRYGYGADSARK